MVEPVKSRLLFDDFRLQGFPASCKTFTAGGELMVYHVIWQLALIIITVKIAGDLSVRIGQPPVLGKLVIGVLLGHSVLGIVAHNGTVEFMAEIGVVLLMLLS